MSNNGSVWKPEQSKAKANRAAVAASTGAGLAGVVAALLFILRMVFGDRLPWAPDQDSAFAQAVEIVLVGLGGIAGAWLGVFSKDKRKYKARERAAQWAGDYRNLTGVVLLGVMLPLGSGCALTPGLVPGLAGNDKNKVAAVDVVGESVVEVNRRGGVKVTNWPDAQSTIVLDHSEFPAGTEAEKRTGFIYEWQDGAFSLNTDASIQNIARAELWRSLSADNRALLEAVAPGITEAATAGLPQLYQFFLERARTRANNPEPDPLVAVLDHVFRLARSAG